MRGHQEARGGESAGDGRWWPHVRRSTSGVRRAVGGHRLGLVPAAVGVALLATACIGPAGPLPGSAPPPSSYCASAPPASPADYNAAFNGLRGSGTGWLTGDLGDPVVLPDGRTLWLFGDTYVGALHASGNIDPTSHFVHNTFVVQSGSCLTPLFAGPPGSRTSLIPDPAAGEWYWPSSAVVEGSTLRVFVDHIQRTGSGPLDFAVREMDVASFSLPGLGFQGVAPMPFATGPADPYGATALASGDGYAYLYGGKQGSVYVARAPLGQIVTPTAWQFWGSSAAGPTWVSSEASAVPMQWSNMPSGFTPGTGPYANPWVQRYGSGYLATAKLVDVTSNDVSVFTAPSPQGPWTYVGQVASTAEQGTFAYDAFSQALPGTSTLTVGYSNNLIANTGTPPLNGQTYGVHFVAPSPNSLPPP